MSDRRTTPDPAFVQTSTKARIAAPLTDLLAAPGGARDRQLLYGDPVTVLGTDGSYSYVRSEKDGYIGWVTSAAVCDDWTPTHLVSALASTAYAEPDFKSPDQATLSMGCRLRAAGETETFIETALGFIPKAHLNSADWRHNAPAVVAARFIGTPYLWGGNSRLGIDCSGLVQIALLTCGIPCPGDSDQQQAVGSDANGPVQEGDLLFWKGHVALALDATTLIHANAHHMATSYEGFDAAIARIAKTDGPVTAHRRL
ncbi:MAG: NlpC/P60 family protein [Pseudomonadota bacterium]